MHLPGPFTVDGRTNRIRAVVSDWHPRFGLKKLVWATRFELATTRLRTEYSDQAELHPEDRLIKTNLY